MTNEQSFDGELLMLFDGDVENCKSELVLPSGTVVSGEGKILDVVNKGHKIKTCKDPFLLSQHRESVSRQGLSREVVDVLTEGKLKIGLILDSLGGSANRCDEYCYAMDLVVARGGDTNAYVFGQAGSAAATIFSNAQHRHVLPDSYLMWHPKQLLLEDVPPSYRRNKALMEPYMQGHRREQQGDIVDIRRFFRKRAAACYWPRINKALSKARRKAKGDPGEFAIAYSGKFLDAAGIAQADPTVSGLVARIRNSFSVNKGGVVDTFLKCRQDVAAVEELFLRVLRRSGEARKAKEKVFDEGEE